jgi:hypothetical protein
MLDKQLLKSELAFSIYIDSFVQIPQPVVLAQEQ